MVIGQRSSCRRLLQQFLTVEPGRDKRRNSGSDQGRLSVVGGARGHVGDELKQCCASFCGAGVKAPVELRLPGTARAVRDAGAGRAAVAARHSVRRPPHLHVGD